MPGPTTYGTTAPWDPATSATAPSPDPVIDKSDIVSVSDLRIIGTILWLVIVIAIIENIACFYAVWVNLRKIMEHPFFQSNVFCVFLSFIDVLLILMVALPTAIAYTMDVPDLWDGLYNRAIVNQVIDYFVWVQLLLIVAISVDRAGHIWKALTYRHSVKRRKTCLALVLCSLIPFLLYTLPTIIAYSEALESNAYRLAAYYNVTVNASHTREAVYHVFLCKSTRYVSVTEPGIPQIFLGCSAKISKDDWKHIEAFQMYENVVLPLVLVLAVAALCTSNGLIIWRLFQSARLQKGNKERQDQVDRSVRITCIVSCCQAILILGSTLPLRAVQIDLRVNSTKEGYKPPEEIAYIGVSCLVFLGPIVNPWLYPIRMASIRTFLSVKKQSVVTSVNTSLSRLRTRRSKTGHHGVTQAETLSTMPGHGCLVEMERRPSPLPRLSPRSGRPSPNLSTRSTGSAGRLLQNSSPA